MGFIAMSSMGLQNEKSVDLLLVPLHNCILGVTLFTHQ